MATDATSCRRYPDLTGYRIFRNIVLFVVSFAACTVVQAPLRRIPLGKDRIGADQSFAEPAGAIWSGPQVERVMPGLTPRMTCVA